MEVEMYFDTGLQDLLSLSQKCEAAAKDCVEGFEGLSNLTRERRAACRHPMRANGYFSEELALSCTYKAGTAQQAMFAVGLFEMSA